MKDKTADALTQIKAEASKCIVVTVFFTTRHSVKKEKASFTKECP